MVRLDAYVRGSLAESIRVKQAILEDLEILADIRAATMSCIETLTQGGRIFLAGNGGSAADAQHIAGEFVSRFRFERPGLPALALTTDTSVITAIGNDYGFEWVFARQLQANAREGDLFIGISTSGNSKNILLGLDVCKKSGVKTVGLTGSDGGSMREQCSICICVPSKETPRIQEAHITIGHIICELAEAALFGAR